MPLLKIFFLNHKKYSFPIHTRFIGCTVNVLVSNFKTCLFVHKTNIRNYEYELYKIAIYVMCCKQPSTSIYAVKKKFHVQSGRRRICEIAQFALSVKNPRILVSLYKVFGAMTIALGAAGRNLQTFEMLQFLNFGAQVHVTSLL